MTAGGCYYEILAVPFPAPRPDGGQRQELSATVPSPEPPSWPTPSTGAGRSSPSSTEPAGSPGRSSGGGEAGRAKGIRMVVKGNPEMAEGRDPNAGGQTEGTSGPAVRDAHREPPGALQ